MSLDYNVSKVDPAAAFVDGKLDPIMKALIFATMAVGLGAITEKNADEFAERLDILQALDGPYMTGPDGPFAITPADVRARVGLTTNVSTETRARWSARIMKAHFTEVERAAKRASVRA